MQGSLSHLGSWLGSYYYILKKKTLVLFKILARNLILFKILILFGILPWILILSRILPRILILFRILQDSVGSCKILWDPTWDFYRVGEPFSAANWIVCMHTRMWTDKMWSWCRDLCHKAGFNHFLSYMTKYSNLIWMLFPVMWHLLASWIKCFKMQAVNCVIWKLV